jgi:hypothetical protein
VHVVIAGGHRMIALGPERLERFERLERLERLPCALSR